MSVQNKFQIPHSKHHKKLINNNKLDIIVSV